MIRLGIELYLDMSINSILNLTQLNKRSQVADVLAAILAIQINLFLIAFSFYYVMTNLWKIRRMPDKVARYNCLFHE